MANVISFLVAHEAVIVAILVGLVSEVMAVRQALKYPDNDGFGGFLAGFLKVLQSLAGPAVPPQA